MPHPNQKVALVTGVSSGIGRATAAALAAAGFRVFGSVRREGVPLPEGVESVRLDVRDDASVSEAIREVVARAERIDVLVNNAGGTVVGAIEETDTAQAQALFDLNFFGAVRVTHAALPHMRAQRSGRIVFIGSVVGFVPAPFMGFYSASKHALEGYAESLDHEVRPLGIRAIVIEPGFMRTRLDESSVRTGGIEDYTSVRERVERDLRWSVEHGEDPQIVARAVVEAATATRPKLHVPVGRGAGGLAALRSLLPAGMFDRGLRKRFHLDG